MPHGKICYHEIPANGAEDSARFYSDTFGWKVRERGDGNLGFDDPVARAARTTGSAESSSEHA
jgi:predicted enzyme related to lactoylglutathione lyase